MLIKIILHEDTVGHFDTNLIFNSEICDIHKEIKIIKAE